MQIRFQSTYRNFRKQARGGTSLIKEVQGKKPSGRALSFSKEREQLDVLKKGRTTLREAFLEKTVPGGQNESVLLVSQESRILQEKPRENEITLLRSDDIECLNFCCTAESLAGGESLLHLFKLTCQGPQCEGLNCNHGRYKEVRKDCHKLLDESYMFMLHIEFPTPLNFVCKKCIGGGWDFFDNMH